MGPSCMGALPTLSLLPGEVTIRVLPGDKMYQAMEIEAGLCAARHTRVWDKR